ncbi:hypothetical protein HZA97_05905 [Candidatus Woesearchaeota archaeon]|nr:hypothetical protein [Candidatus Woesearchaeota archaeon]
MSNKLALGVVLILVLAVLSTPFLLKEKDLNLENTLEKIREIDTKYNTNWKQEGVGVGASLIGFTFIDDALKDVDALREEIKKNSDKLQEKTELSTWEEVLTKLTNAREKMLLAQKEYLKYEALGPAGELEFEYILGSPVVKEKVNCDEMEQLDQGANFLQKTLDISHEFESELDFVLQNAPESRRAELIGVNDDKPAFYKSKLGRISTQIKLNKWAVDTCKRKVYKLSVNS